MSRIVLYIWALLVSCSNPMTDSAPTTRPNLALPTLGGKQVWADRRWQEGWRVQQNVLSGHHRLLDPNDRRRAWGSLAACELAMRERAPSARPEQDSLVVLLHGMGRSRAAFAKMQDRLGRRGWAVASISYPSTRRPIDGHVEQLGDLLENLEGYREVSFVTHSLGGIVVRRMLAEDGAWRRSLHVQRMVMLAPPNQGADFAAKLESFAPFRWLFGETGSSLTPEALSTLPEPDVPFLVIAGARGDADSKGWNPMLEGDDDWVVRVEETHLPGEAAHLTIASLHTFLMNQDAVIASTAAFLRDGTILPIPADQ
ncbi:MAG: alpha/beta fold hydrolase [Planctomycetota bacterium]|jgi:hypothetical protein